MSKELLNLQNVSFSYESGSAVLEDLNLSIKIHDLIVIKGESGSGKSTFLKLLNRFFEISSGIIRYHDKDLSECAIDEIRRSVIYLPQTPYVIDGTIEDNLRFPFHLNVHQSRIYDPQQAREWLDYFQLRLPLSHDALKLSIGQRQRISLIRALLLEPDLLLLDEPGSALDSNNKQLIEQKIEQLTRSSEITVIMVTHSETSFSYGSYRSFILENKHLIEKTIQEFPSLTKRG